MRFWERRFQKAFPNTSLFGHVFWSNRARFFVKSGMCFSKMGTGFSIVGTSFSDMGKLFLAWARFSSTWARFFLACAAISLARGSCAGDKTWASLFVVAQAWQCGFLAA